MEKPFGEGAKTTYTLTRTDGLEEVSYNALGPNVPLVGPLEVGGRLIRFIHHVIMKPQAITGRRYSYFPAQTQ
jgi:hypothetical protein